MLCAVSWLPGLERGAHIGSGGEHEEQQSHLIYGAERESRRRAAREHPGLERRATAPRTEHPSADYLAYDPRLAEPREHVAEAMCSGEEDGEGQENMTSIGGRVGHGRQPCELTDGESRGFGREQGAGSRAGRSVAATPSDPRVAAAPLFSRRAGLVAARLNPRRQGTPDALAARP